MTAFNTSSTSAIASRRFFRAALSLLILGLALLSAACGGSGDDAQPGNTGNSGSGAGSGGGSGGGNSTPTYNVGGTVTGMTGSGLVITNNTTDQLTLNDAGDFVFAEELEAGQTFDVRVDTQPGDPANVCTIENASGTIGTADDVVEKPRIAINDRGDILVAWLMRHPTNFRTDVWARRYDPNSDWLDSVLLSTNSRNPVEAPRPALDSDGDAQVIWIEERTITDAVMASHYAVSGGLTEPYGVPKGASN